MPAGSLVSFPDSFRCSTTYFGESWGRNTVQGKVGFESGVLGGADSTDT